MKEDLVSLRAVLYLQILYYNNVICMKGLPLINYRLYLILSNAPILQNRSAIGNKYNLLRFFLVANVSYDDMECRDNRKGTVSLPK